MRIGCVIMASGESARFGSDKLTTPFLGAPLILHALRQLPPSLDRSVVVTRNPAVHALAASVNIPSVLHTVPNQSDTIRIGLARMAGMDGCLFLVGDQPLCSMATMSRMVATFHAHPARIVRACWQGRCGNPVLFPSPLFGELSALLPGETGGEVIKRHAGLVLPLEVHSPLELEDIDTPAQLAALEARAASLPMKTQRP